MLRLSQTLVNRPILSLRVGNVVATATRLLINPNNLKIEGIYCLDRFEKKKSLILLTNDIREFSPKGYIVNDHEVLSEASELLRLKEVIDINFELMGKPVVTVSKKKVGKVSDFAVEENSFFVQKLYVNESLVRNFNGGQIIIDRSQIVEITNHRIVIHDLLQAVPAGAAA